VHEEAPERGQVWHWPQLVGDGGEQQQQAATAGRVVVVIVGRVVVQGRHAAEAAVGVLRVPHGGGPRERQHLHEGHGRHHLPLPRLRRGVRQAGEPPPPPVHQARRLVALLPSCWYLMEYN